MPFTSSPTGAPLPYAIRPLPDGGGVATHEDVSEQRRIEARMQHMAHHDALTDLPNRVLLRERLEDALKGSAPVAVLWLDLDRFKEVNDTLGHATGDALLKAVTERLLGCVRDRDTVARLGGDEFAVIQTGAGQPLGATTLALRIIEAISAPYQINDQQVVVGASVGISVAPDDATDADQLLRNADLALYRAKNEGRGTYRFFELGMDARMHARRQLELDLRSALANDGFELHYQPVFNLDTNNITAFEALLRWNHPERGSISPTEFIPLAEETGLISAIGAWVLQEACKQATTWPGQHQGGLSTCRPFSSNTAIWCSWLRARSTRQDWPRHAWISRSPNRCCSRTPTRRWRCWTIFTSSACASPWTISAPAFRA
jgi:diguanylate cyclase (GGDEF)-like protein